MTVLTPEALNVKSAVTKVARADARRGIVAAGDAGGQLLADLLLERPDWLLTATIGKVLRWVRRIGPGGMLAILTAADVRNAGGYANEYRLVGELSDRQVAVIVAKLEGQR